MRSNFRSFLEVGLINRFRPLKIESRSNRRPFNGSFQPDDGVDLQSKFGPNIRRQEDQIFWFRGRLTKTSVDNECVIRSQAVRLSQRNSVLGPKRSIIYSPNASRLHNDVFERCLQSISLKATDTYLTEYATLIQWGHEVREPRAATLPHKRNDSSRADSLIWMSILMVVCHSVAYFIPEPNNSLIVTEHREWKFKCTS